MWHKPVFHVGEVRNTDKNHNAIFDHVELSNVLSFRLGFQVFSRTPCKRNVSGNNVLSNETHSSWFEDKVGIGKSLQFWKPCFLQQDFKKWPKISQLNLIFCLRFNLLLACAQKPASSFWELRQLKKKTIRNSKD